MTDGIGARAIRVVDAASGMIFTLGFFVPVVDMRSGPGTTDALKPAQSISSRIPSPPPA